MVSSCVRLSQGVMYEQEEIITKIIAQAENFLQFAANAR